MTIESMFRKLQNHQVSQGPMVPSQSAFRIQLRSLASWSLGLSRQHRAMAAVLAAAFIVSLAAGCRHNPGPGVVATVNGQPIMRSELEHDYQASLGNSGKHPSAEQAEAMRLGILRQLINQKILEQQAAKLHLVATDAEVDDKIAKMKAPYTEEEFDKKLAESGLTMKDLRREVRSSLTMDKLINKEVMSRVNITDADISRFYETHKSQFDFIEPKYHIAEVVVTTHPSGTEQGTNLQNSKAQNPAQALKKIEMLQNRLESGDDFATVAMNFSENPNDASNGGDMGLIPESALRSDPAVFAAISKLKPGQITGIIPLIPPGSKTPVEYAIYKLLEIEPAGQRDLSDPRVQQHIRGQLREARSQLLRAAYYEMLRDQAHVKNYLASEVFKNSAQ